MNKEEVPKQALKQKHFHKHYYSNRHNGIGNWVITLIDSVNTWKELQRKELHWMHWLKTYALNGLNERYVYEVF